MSALWFAGIRRLTQSQFVLIMMFTTIFLVALRVILPWSDVLSNTLPNWYISKTVMILSIFKETTKADFAIFGSSLALAPGREAALNLEPNANEQTILRLVYKGCGFKNEIERAYGPRLQVRNLGISGATVSDYDDLLNEMENRKCLPKHILLALAPRDFLDTTLGGGNAQKDTYFKKMLLCFIHSTFFPNCAEPNSILGWIEANKNFYLFAKISTINALTSFSQKKLNRDEKPSILSTVSRGKPKSTQQIKIDDLNGYRRTYQSGDDGFRQMSFSRLQRFTDRCKRNSIPLTLVLMPLSADNKCILGNQAIRQFSADITTMSLRSNCVILDLLNSDQYFDEDFADSCHLNNRGSKKFFLNLREKLFSTPPLHKVHIEEQTWRKKDYLEYQKKLH